ncbi:adenosylmethionine decarboxylase [Candidatus Wolfebacteria bacterium]|nr:adenosylmethionine decarboxylase [Candidatus Wolfebacteria bacterium]
MSKSLHILADLHSCEGNAKYLTSVTAIKKIILQAVKQAGFSIVAHRFYKFTPGGNVTDGGITGMIIVSESHIAIHTWPEKKFVNFDVFFCNYSRNNSEKTRKVFKDISNIYKPGRMRKREVWRD